MRKLLDEGVDVDARNSDGDTSLCVAARLRLVSSVRFLIENGADVNARGELDLTPLMLACSRGQKKGSECALMLIEAGADVRFVRDDEMTALKFAVKSCSPAVIQALIDAGARIEGPRGTSQTPLMLAARANNVDTLKVLITNGADPKRKCKLPWAKGLTAEAIAELEKRQKALAYLRGLGRGDAPRPSRKKPAKATSRNACRFELKGGKSAKFWEIVVDGATHTVTFGRIGTDGQTKRKEFSSAEEAGSAAERLIEQKLRKGYAETRGAKKTAKKAPSETWSKLAAKLEIRPPKRGVPAKPPTPEDIAEYERRSDLCFPPSYASFVVKFGPGLMRRYFRIYAPPTTGRKWLNNLFAERGSELMTSIYGEQDFIARMIPFSDTIGGDLIVWDPTEITRKRPLEYRIYVLPRDAHEIFPLVDSFNDFIWKVCLGNRLIEAIEAELIEDWPVDYTYDQFKRKRRGSR